MERDLKVICEDAVIELEIANKMFHNLWEEYFTWLEEPKEWKYAYNSISAQLTAYKFFVDRITETLLTAYGMAPEHCAIDYKLLYKEAMQMWPEYSKE